MINNDVVSTIVERFYLTEELEKIDTEILESINNAGSFSKSAFFSDDLIAKITRVNSGGQSVVLSRPEIVLNLKELRSRLKEVSTLEIVCPMIADADFKKRIALKVKAANPGLFAIKFGTRNDLIAGAQITFKGKFKDYSLAKKLEDNKEAIFSEVLKSYD